MKTDKYAIEVIANNGYKMKVAEAYSKGIAYIIGEKMSETYRDNIYARVTVKLGEKLIYEFQR